MLESQIWSIVFWLDVYGRRFLDIFSESLGFLLKKDWEIFLFIIFWGFEGFRGWIWRMVWLELELLSTEGYLIEFMFEKSGLLWNEIFRIKNFFDLTKKFILGFLSIFVWSPNYFFVLIHQGAKKWTN